MSFFSLYRVQTLASIIMAAEFEIKTQKERVTTFHYFYFIHMQECKNQINSLPLNLPTDSKDFYCFVLKRAANCLTAVSI